MFDNELEDIENMDAAQAKFREANDAGYERGLAGNKYLDPFEAVPELCKDRKNRIDRFTAFHYDRGFLTAYGVYLDNHPEAAEDIMFRRLADKYCIVDEAQKRGTIAYEEGRSAAAVVTEVYELLPGPSNDMNLSVYDGWELGYLLGMMYDESRQKTGNKGWAEFDYDRAYALVYTSELVREDEKKPDRLTLEERVKLAEKQMPKFAKSDCTVPVNVAEAFRNARSILEATEDDSLTECLTCPFHYGMHTGESCDRDCYETAVNIQAMIGTEDDVLRAWLVHN